MIRSLVQFAKGDLRGVAALDEDGRARVVTGCATTRELTQRALRQKQGLVKAAGAMLAEPLDLCDVQLLTPIDHPDQAHLFVTGTGLTHLGSAEGLDKMHKAAAAGQATDSMRIFLMGLEGGRPEAGAVGVQPEWFYKGDGSILVPPGGPLAMPAFAGDGGEEPEIAGIYMVDEDGVPTRLGFALGNEFSHHVTERENYLWLAHSKLRQAVLGAELRLGVLPADVQGTVRIWRGEAMLWEKGFASGEANMSHSIEISNIIISNIASGAGRAMSMCIFSAPPRYPSRTASRRRSATGSR